MKKFGLLGGTSWHSTVEYYTEINRAINERHGDNTNPRLQIASLNQKQLHDLQRSGDWNTIAGLFIEAARGGGHQTPEEPYGLSLLNASDEKTIWDLPLKGYAPHQNGVFNTDLAAQFLGNNQVTLDFKAGQARDKVSLLEGGQGSFSSWVLHS